MSKRSDFVLKRKLAGPLPISPSLEAAWHESAANIRMVLAEVRERSADDPDRMARALRLDRAIDQMESAVNELGAAAAALFPPAFFPSAPS